MESNRGTPKDSQPYLHGLLDAEVGGLLLRVLLLVVHQHRVHVGAGEGAHVTVVDHHVAGHRLLQGLRLRRAGLRRRFAVAFGRRRAGGGPGWMDGGMDGWMDGLALNVCDRWRCGAMLKSIAILLSLLFIITFCSRKANTSSLKKATIFSLLF